MTTPGYVAATTAAAVLDRKDLEYWTFTGRDPARMLSGVVTGRMPTSPTSRGDGLEVGEATLHTVLTPKGRMVADLRLGADTPLEGAAPGLWALVPSAASEGLRAHLKRYLPPRFAVLDVPEGIGVLGLVGPDADDLVSSVVLDRAISSSELGELPAGGVVSATGSGLRFVRYGETGIPGWTLIGPTAELAALRQRLVDAGATSATPGDWTVVRVEAGTPAFGVDMDDTTMPPEVGLEDTAIDHAKGCYTGQEVIVRIRDRGHVNRKLMRIRLGDVEPPALGTEVFVPGRDKPAATVRSAVRSPRFGETVALAYVRREVWSGEGQQPEFSLPE